MRCLLCRFEGVLSLAKVEVREYFQCQHCRLVFLDPAQRLSVVAERRHYEEHQNHPEDADYRNFLSRVTVPLVERLAPGMEGLDYGCGPGPTLSVMLQEQGLAMKAYDPFFANDAKVLQGSYDFITCTETAEHFHRPAEEFQRLNRLLRPGGWLGVMTEMMPQELVFENWYYMRDPTHVCFYQRQTMQWLAKEYSWSVEFPHRNVALFNKL